MMTMAGAFISFSCVPRVRVENHLGHPFISAPPLRDHSLAFFFQVHELPTGKGEEVRLFHDSFGAYGMLRRRGIGVEISASNWFLYPGVFLFKKFGDHGILIKGSLSKAYEMSGFPAIASIYLFMQDRYGQIFMGGRLGGVLAYTYMRYDTEEGYGEVSKWGRGSLEEVFFGFEGNFRKNIGLIAVFSIGNHGKGVYAYSWPEDSHKPCLVPTSERFSQLQLGANFRF